MLLWYVAGIQFLLLYHLTLIEAVSTSSPTNPPTTYPSTTYPSLSPSTTFIITTIAGTGSSGYSGDNGAATSATVNGPSGLAVDSAGIYC